MSSCGEQNDIELEKAMVKRAQKNPKAFGGLYSKYKDKIYYFIKKKVGTRTIAEDLTSVVFEKALKGLGYFQWQGVSFGAWLYRIARNTIYDYYRTDKEKRQASLDENLDSADLEDYNQEALVLHGEKELELYSVISRLDDKDQYLLYFKYFEGYSNKEISKLTGMSETNIGTRLHRIRKKMKLQIR